MGKAVSSGLKFGEMWRLLKQIWLPCQSPAFNLSTSLMTLISWQRSHCRREAESSLQGIGATAKQVIETKELYDVNPQDDI